MRKVIGTALVLTIVVAGMTSAHAGKRWTAEGNYDTPAPGGCVEAAGHYACGYYINCPEAIGCAIVELPRQVRAVNVEVIDDSGLPTRARIYTPWGGHVATICGKSTSPVVINGAYEMWVHPIGGMCQDSSPSVATTGVVRVTPAAGG